MESRLALKILDGIYDVSYLIDGWADWQIAFKRDLLSVSSKTTTFPLKFTGMAKTHLEESFAMYRNNTKASLLVATGWHYDTGARLLNGNTTFESVDSVAKIATITTPSTSGFGRNFSLSFRFATREDLADPEDEVINNVISYTVKTTDGLVVCSGVTEHNKVEDIFTDTFSLPTGYDGTLTLEFFNSYDYMYYITRQSAYVKNIILQEYSIASDGTIYDEMEEFELDFNSYNVTDTSVELSLKSIGLRELIKKYGSTEYNFLLAAVAESKKFKHTRVTLNNSLNMKRADFLSRGNSSGKTVNGVDFQNGVPTKWDTCSMGLSFDSADTPVKDCLFYTDSEAGSGDKYVSILRTGTYKVVYSSEADANIVTFIFRDAAHYNAFMNQFYTGTVKYVAKYQLLKNGTVISTATYNMNTPPRTTTESYSKAVFAHYSTKYNNVLFQWTGTVKAGEILSMQVTIEPTDHNILNPELYGGYAASEILFAGSGTLTTSYTLKSVKQRDFACVKPAALLKAMLIQMGAGVVDVEDLSGDFMADNIVLIPPDVLNGAKVPYIKMSYSRLYSFIRMLCCDIRYDMNKATIVKLHGNNSAFTEQQVYSYDESETADLKESTLNDILFSTVNIGSTASFDGVNKSKEFNLQYTYNLNVPSTNSLDLTTPLRMDSVGFESAINDNPLKVATDAKDIFAIHVTTSGLSYVASPTTVNNVASDMLNGAITPKHLFKRWHKLIGFTDVVKFVSSEANADQTVNAEKLNDNITWYNVQDKLLLSPIAYDVATADKANFLGKKTLDGYVTFINNGTTYKGFVSEMTDNPLLRKQKEMKLIRYADNENYPYVPLNVVSEAPLFRVVVSGSVISITYNVYGDPCNGYYGTPIIQAEWMSLFSQDIQGSNKCKVEFNISPNYSTSSREVDILLEFNGETFVLAHVIQDRSVDTTIQNSNVTLAYGSLSDGTAVMYSVSSDISYAVIDWQSTNFGFFRVITFTGTYNGVNAQVQGFPAYIFSLEYDETLRQQILHVYGSTDRAGSGYVSVAFPTLGQNVFSYITITFI